MQQLSSIVPGNTSIWIHCASLGEFEVAIPVIRLILGKNPDERFVLTFFSGSGYGYTSKNELINQIFPSPLDTRIAVAKFAKQIQPKLVIISKNEIWPNMLWYLEENDIPYVFLAPSFSSFHWWYKYRKIFPIVKSMKNAEALFLAKEETNGELEKLGFSNLIVAGDPRIDRILEIKHQSTSFPLIESFCSDQEVMVFGSVHKEDWQILVPLCNEGSDSKLIIVPHDLKEQEITDLATSLGHEAVRYSQAIPETIAQYRLLILDKIGLLSSIYRYANIAYVGGGFGKGVHNILEAAVFGIPVLFGPEHRKFPEAIDLISRGVAFPIKNADEALSAIQTLRILSSKEKIKESVTTFFENHKGASHRVYSYLQSKNLLI